MPLINLISTDILLAFWDRIEKQEDGCWLWTGATNPGKNRKAYGYVRWRLNGIRAHLYAHRVAYVLAHGLDLADIKGKDVHHSCDHSLCIRPEHLKAMTTSAHALHSNLMRWEEEAWRQTATVG